MVQYPFGTLPQFVADAVNGMYAEDGVERVYVTYDTNRDIFYIFGLVVNVDSEDKHVWTRVGRVDGKYMFHIGDNENIENIDSEKVNQGLDTVILDAIERAEDEVIFHATEPIDAYILPNDDQLINDLDGVLESVGFTNLKRRKQ